MPKEFNNIIMTKKVIFSYFDRSIKVILSVDFILFLIGWGEMTLIRNFLLIILLGRITG
jgi:hypothetical protein